jgi:hypothetical protein
MQRPSSSARLLGTLSRARFRECLAYTLVALLAVTFAQLAAPPAGAQGGHVHKWAKGKEPDAPLAVWHMQANGSKGDAVDANNPARPCEVLLLEPKQWADEDWCVDEDGNVNADGPVNAGRPNDPGLEILYWSDNGADGHFVETDGASHWVNAEDGSGNGLPHVRHYRVDRDSTSGGQQVAHVTINFRVGNANFVYARDGDTDSDPYTFPVEGDEDEWCPIPTGREVDPGDEST